MVSWNQKELRALLDARSDFSDENIDFAKNLMYSIDWKVKAKKYHLGELRRASKPLKGGADSDISRVLDGLINRSSKNFSEYNRLVYEKEFNVIAAAQTVHSLPEIILQLACLLDSGCEVDIHNISLKRSYQKLSFDRVRSSLEEIIDAENYKYLNAFTNITKHRSLVKPSFNISLIGDDSELIFEAFGYQGADFSRKSESDFIQELNDLTSDLIKTCVFLNEDFKEIGD